MKLSEALKVLENSGYGPIVEVEFEKDHWKIKAYSNGQLLQLKTDLKTGMVISDTPPKLERPLSEIVHGLEAQGYGPILDIERASTSTEAGPVWDVETYQGKSEVKIVVDSAGKIVGN